MSSRRKSSTRPSSASAPSTYSATRCRSRSRSAAPRRARRRCRSPRNRPSAPGCAAARASQRQHRRLLHEAEVVGLEHLAEVEVLQLRGMRAVDHLHHFVGGDPVGEHPGDEGAGAGADVDVEVVDRAVDREQVEGAQGADLVDPAGEAAAAEHEGGLRWAFCGRAPSRLRLDVHNFAHKHGLSHSTEADPGHYFAAHSCATACVSPWSRRPAGAPASALCASQPGRRGSCAAEVAPAASSSSTARPEAGLRTGRRHAAAVGLEHEAVHDLDRPRAAGPDSRIETSVVADGPVDRNGVLHGSLYLVGGGDPPWARPPSTTLSRWPGNRPTPLEEPDLAGRHPRDHGSPLRRRQHLRPPARRRRLRLRDQPLHRPALGPFLRFRLHGSVGAASPPTRPSSRPRRWRGPLRAGRHPSPASRWARPPPWPPVAASNRRR